MSNAVHNHGRRPDGLVRAALLIGLLLGAPVRSLSKPERADTRAAKSATERAAATETAPAVMPPPRDPQPIQHAAVRSRVKASSTHEGEPGEGGAEALVDGDLATRWSSDYAEPQQILVTLGRAVSADTLVLHWENACAKRYSVAVSPDGESWRPIHLYLNATAVPNSHTDTIPLKGAPVKAIRIDLLQRVNDEWGFSLFEVELKESD